MMKIRAIMCVIRATQCKIARQHLEFARRSVESRANACNPRDTVKIHATMSGILQDAVKVTRQYL